VESGVVQVQQPDFRIRAFYGIHQELLSAFDPLLELDALEQQYSADDADDGAPHFDLQQRLRLVEEELQQSMGESMTLGQVVGLPLRFERELVGIIYLFRSEHAFSPLDNQFLQGFADQAAIAVRNARLYQQLATEGNRLSTVIENSADGIMFLDANRRVVAINQALAAMLNLERAEAIGQPCSSVMQLDNVEGDNLCDNADLLDEIGPEGLLCEGDIVRPGGSHISVAVTYTPLYDEQERLVNIIANVHDITRFREEEEMKSTFTSIISHELKTPVALIKGYAQTLARPDAQWDAETARQSLEIIEEEADRLEGLINNLLDASRIQASGLRLDFSYVDLANMATKVAQAYRTQSDHHVIELDFPPDLPAIWGDEERLRQVLTNLISNSIKYSPEGGSIRIGGWLESITEPGSHVAPDTASGGRVVLYVADNGIGIPQAELPHIFERFYRVDSSLRRSTAGAGLGLFLCKAIVDAHNGSIWVRSESQKGTTFFVALPLEPSEGDAVI
jgi:PAS domain S-box-containing protein